MPRKLEVEQHSKKQQIIKALVRGDTYREITGKYGVTKSALSRYLNRELLQKAAMAKEARDLSDGKKIVEEIQDIMVKARKMYEACDEYLTDPKDNTKYFLGPRAHEVEVAWEEEIGDGENPRTVKRRDTLENLLSLAGKSGRYSSVKYRYADPRKLLLDTANTLNRHLELLSRIIGAIKEAQINIINNPSFTMVQQVILDATKDYPEVREKIAKELEKID